MIDYIRGSIAVKELGHVTLDVNGIGYGIGIPLSTYEKLGAPGTVVTLQIHYHVREDAHLLYGFYSPEELNLFRQLIGISKIGPKVALSVLSGVSVHDLAQSVNTGDISRLKKIPGVGAKTAERLILELKGKLGAAYSGPAPAGVSFVNKKMAASVKDEVYAAMLSLGYNEKQVAKALERVGESGVGNDEPVEVWIRKALQVI